MNTAHQQFVIGYFNIRGKAQVPRLLCQYTKVPYINKFYTPKQFLQEKGKNPNFTLPYLKKSQLSTSGPQEMSYFLLTQSNNQQMLGKTEDDKVRVKMYCWSIDSFATVIGSNSAKRPQPGELQKQWQKNLKLKLKKYEKAAIGNGNWFLGYLTLIDFSIYELVRYMEWMFPGKMKVFLNLSNIKSKISLLPEIKAYQSSAQCVKEISPEFILKEIFTLTTKTAKKK